MQCFPRCFFIPSALVLSLAAAAGAAGAGDATGVANSESPAPRVLTRAHAHNDYLHPRPLLDALDQGFTSVEADIFLVGQDLLVAHTKRELKPERTLEALYLEPLMERARAHGAIHPGLDKPDSPTFTLLIDQKTAPQPTWDALKLRLEKYKELFTEFEGGKVVRRGPVVAIISGDNVRAELVSPVRRLAALDGRVADLDGPAAADPIPLVSNAWSGLFKWNGVGEPPAEVAERMAEIVGKAHAQGRRVRFWGTPDGPDAWRAQYAAGVDLINTDKLAELAAFLNAQPK